MAAKEAPRCTACDHVPLTLLVFANSQIVCARVGCVCRSTMFYEGGCQQSEQPSVPVETRDPERQRRLPSGYEGTARIQSQALAQGLGVNRHPAPDFS
jgi:hypothetical protein